MRRPTIYRYHGRMWHGGFERLGSENLLREFCWMLRNGRWGRWLELARVEYSALAVLGVTGRSGLPTLASGQ